MLKNIKERGLNLKRSNNYLDNIPKTNKKWKITKEGMVEITVENKGFFHKIAQKFYKKPRYSFIKLDEFGRFAYGDRLMERKRFMKSDRF